MKNKNLKIEYKNIDELIPYVNNARKNESAVDKVASSIKNFGMVNPILIDGGNEIIAGHTRLLALKKLGYKQTPTIKLANLTPAEAKALRLADNKTAEFAEWDFEALAIELQEIDEFDLDFDMSDFGFEVEELNEEVEEDDFELVVPEEPRAKLGDIYQLGRHRLMCGDSTDKEQIKKLVNGQLVDMFLTDPPYNVSYVGGTKEALTIQNDEMNNDDFRKFLVDAFAGADEVMKPGAVFYIWHADSEGYNFRGACFEVGWQVRQCLIWNKNSMVMSRQDYHWKHEPCLYGWKSGAGHLWASDRKQTTILNFDRRIETQNIQL